MRYTSQTAVYVAGIWGLMYALFIQRTEIGKTLVKSTTWLSVAIGVGVDLLLALPIVPRSARTAIARVVLASSIGIIARSLINEVRAIQMAGVINGQTHSRQRRKVH